MKNSFIKPTPIRLLTSAATAAIALSTTSVFAHPGHSLTDASMSHVLLSPYHLAMLAVSGVACYVGARFVQRQLPKQVLRHLGVVLLLSSAVLWGLRS